MTNLTQKLYRAEQVKAMDDYAIKELGISGTVLMERAGEAAFAMLQARWPQAKDIVVVCGTGNNGGDGYVVARLAKQAGCQVTVMQVGDTAKLSGDALAAAQRLQSVDILPVALDRALILRCDVIVDALLGIGLRGSITGELHDAIQMINQVKRPVLSLDIPSGINADNGMIHDVAVRADATITFIANKQGLFHGDAMDYVGELRLESLNAPLGIYELHEAQVEQVDTSALNSLLSARPRNSHKGHFGHVLIIGGEQGYIGAPRMAGEAAARVGAGLVSIGTRREHAAVMGASRPELMVHGVEDEAAFLRLSEQATVIVIGPGLGQSEWAQQLLGYAIDSGHPLIVDADALNLLAHAPHKRHNWILTPHAGEAARLLGKSSQEVQRDRFAAARELQDAYGGIVVLKGAGTLICGPDDPILLCARGNPGMATGGMGDMLTGVISGLLAQGINILDAAALGVCIHAEAGDAAARSAGERGLLPGDLMSWVRRLANPQPGH